MLLNILNQPILILAELKEVALLTGLFHGTTAVGALAVLQLKLRPEGLAGRAVPAFILTLVNVALIVQLLEHLLHAFHVTLVGGADEIVIFDVHQLPQILDARNDLVYVFLGRYTLFLGLALDLLTMLVGTGKKISIVAGHLLEPRHGIYRRGAVGMTDMQIIAGIVNGRCNVEFLFLFAFLTHGRFLLQPIKKPPPAFCTKGRA